MKKISLALGTAGGVCALLAAVAIFCVLTMGPEYPMISYGPWGIPPVIYPEELDGLIYCLVIAASGVLGIAGGLLSRRYNVAGGVLMIVASMPNLSALPFILLLAGGIFALNREKSPVPIANQNASNISSARSCGITGSIFAIVCPVLILLRNIFSSDVGEFSFSINVWGRQLSLPPELMPLILAAAILAGVGLLLNGAVLVNRKTKVSGVLMLVGAVLNLGTFIAALFLLTGGIYALTAEKLAVPTAEPKGESA